MRASAVLLMVVGLLWGWPATTPAQTQPQRADSARALAELLQNEEARQALVERLLEVADAEGAPVAVADELPLQATLARRFAEYTRGIAETLAEVPLTVAEGLSGVSVLFSEEGPDVLVGLWEALWGLAAVIAVTAAAYLVLRWIAQRLFAGIAERARGAALIRTLFHLIVSAGVDAVAIALAWAAGYVFALWSGEGGRMELQQTLFLNAFLFIELTRVVLRGMLAPKFRNLRVVPLSDMGAAYWYFWLSRLVLLVGYGALLVVPIVNYRVSYPAGRGLAVVIALTALAMAVAVVLQNRAGLRAWLEARADRQRGEVLPRITRFAALHWHQGVIVYLLALFSVWLMRPEDGLAFMLQSTFQSAVAIGVGILVMMFISRWITGGMRLPDDVKLRLPLLEARLNAFVPAILKAIRLIVMGAVLIALMQVWQVFDFLGWLATATGQDVVTRLVAASVIALLAIGVYLAVTSWIDYRLNPNYGAVPTARERTLLALLRNAFTIALVVITAMLVLAELGMNIGPLLAGAGVLGLAIGFGAQKLVQDVITGAFIQLENAMNEGDVVSVAGTTGVVERLTIRSVGLRDLSGVYHLIPFSSADRVSNFMRDFGFHVASVGVAYRERIPEVKEAMHEAFRRLKGTDHGANIIVDELEMHGVTDFADSAVVVRARIKCLPGTQWGVGRAYNEFLKEVFDERDIEIPFPHLTLYHGVDKEGGAPPMRVLQEVVVDSRRELAAPQVPGEGGGGEEAPRLDLARPERDAPGEGPTGSGEAATGERPEEDSPDRKG